MPEGVIAPGAHIEVRDAVWRVVQVDRTSSDKRALRVVGLSEIVRDQEAIFLEEYEPELNVLDPRETRLVVDPTAGHRRARLYLESKLRRLAPTSPEPDIGRLAALDLMEFQLQPARLAMHEDALVGVQLKATAIAGSFDGQRRFLAAPGDSGEADGSSAARMPPQRPWPMTTICLTPSECTANSSAAEVEWR